MKTKCLVFFFVLFLGAQIWANSFTMYENIEDDRYPYESNTQVGGQKVRIPGFGFRKEYEVTADNKAMILNIGIVSLQKRIQMIQKAQTSLELEYYIFQDDEAGKVLMTELVAAAKRGVKVRVLIDVADTGRAYFKINEYYVKALRELLSKDNAEDNFEIRYYNDYSRLLHISSSYFRNHRKLFVKDGVEAIVGGRNIGDDYFDLSEDFNFNDRDIWVKGTVVPVMLDTFNAFWNHKITMTRKLPSEPQKPSRANSLGKSGKTKLKYFSRRLKNYRNKITHAKNFFTENAKGKALKKEIERITGPELARLESTQIMDCPKTTFVSDRPGANFLARIKRGYPSRFRKVRNAVEYRIKNSKTLVVSSPYFMKSKWAAKLFNDLLDDNEEINKDISLFTNSLASVDFPLVTAHFKKRIDRYLAAGYKIYVHSGNWLGEDGVPAISTKIRDARWGTHAKTHIYDEDGFMIGTFNFDSRSAYYNTELALFCDGNEILTNIVKDSLLYRKDHLSDPPRGIKINDADDIHADAGFFKRLLMKIMRFVNLEKLF